MIDVPARMLLRNFVGFGGARAVASKWLNRPI